MKQAENGGAIDTIIAAEKSTGALRIVTNSDNNVYYEARKAEQFVASVLHGTSSSVRFGS